MTDADVVTLTERFVGVHHRGVINAFGPQRFGINGATLAVAQAWGRGDHAAAVERIVDPTGGWHLGEPIPDRWYGGPEGRVVAALRKGLAPDKALRQVDDRLVKLVASAAQSAVFNAVLAARQAAGLTHRVRAGDIACNSKGAPFVVVEADVPDLERRCAPGVLDAFATGPLPGGQRLQPASEVLAEEHAWSAATGVDWTWFQDRAVFASPGERRPLVVPLRAAPTVRLDGAVVRVELALPSGTYATTVLEQTGVAVPDDRR
jgi:tRNA pseudouridine13 synthase